MNQEGIQVINTHPLEDPVYSTDQLFLGGIITGNLVICVRIQATLRLNVEIIPMEATLLKGLAKVNLR